MPTHVSCSKAENKCGRIYFPHLRFARLFITAREIVLDAVFPHKCICGQWGVLLCEECKGNIRIDKTSLCPVCKCISKYGRTCTACRHKSYLTGVMILGPHKGILKDLIWKYKYRFVRDVSSPLAGLVCDTFGDFLRNKRLIVTFAPISKSRLRYRGFNQAQLLAEKVSTTLDLESRNCLFKDDSAIPQVGHSRRERLANIKGKIHYESNTEITNKRILIIDDVYTTGATLEECAKVLREAGYREVWGLVLSRD